MSHQRILWLSQGRRYPLDRLVQSGFGDREVNADMPA